MNSSTSIAGAIVKDTLAGAIVKDATGRYSLPTAQTGRRTANLLSVVISHTSAATEVDLGN